MQAFFGVGTIVCLFICPARIIRLGTHKINGKCAAGSVEMNNRITGVLMSAMAFTLIILYLNSPYVRDQASIWVYGHVFGL